MRKGIIFLLLFSVLGFIFLQIPFTKLAGSNVSFTVFDFFAPIAGAFLGTPLGVLSVFLVEIINFFVKNTPFNLGSVIRLFPILFATIYFANIKKGQGGKLILAVPIFAMVAFLAHPAGRQVWYYSLFWLIPLIAYFRRDLLFLRSLGATFTAHSVGGALWIWAFNLPATVWQNLIPVVIAERFIFAVGITVSFVVVKRVLKVLIERKLLPSLSALS